MRQEDRKPGKVVALSEYRELPEQPQIALVRSYWDRLRGDRIAPARSEIDPKEIAPVLAQTCVLEQIAPGHARFRLAGMHICDLMGMEVRGMPVSTLFQVPAREALAAELEKLFGGSVTMTLALRAGHGLGRPALEAQLLLLPLADHRGGLTRALGCLVTSGSIGYPPRRFALCGSQHRRIVGSPPSEVAPPAAAPAGAPDAAPVKADGFADAPAAFRARPALHLVQTDGD